jgi:hypothetical protein
MAHRLPIPIGMNKNRSFTPENMIKGRIAEAIIEELLKASGNDVYRFGYESILQNLVQRRANFDRSNKNAHQLQSIPDFVVLNPEGNNFFLEVKFRAKPEWLLKDPLLRSTTEYWQPKLILVTTVKPYFRIVTPESLGGDCCSFEPLDADPDFHVTRAALETFEPLVQRFLVNGKTSGNSLPATDYRDAEVRLDAPALVPFPNDPTVFSKRRIARPGVKTWP